MRYLLMGAVAITSMMCAVPFARAEDAAVFAAVDQYSEAIGKFQADTAMRGSLENVYHKGQAAASGLVSVLESLSPEGYDSIVKKMRGYVLNRDEGIFVLPDFKFYYGLAKKQGTDADIAFFSFMSDFRPDNVWPAFIEQQTDYGGCTNFGAGVLTDLYGKGINRSKKYPSVYKRDIDEAIEQIRDELTVSNCACGDMDSVIKELELFIATFPADGLTPVVRQRLSDVKSRKSTMRFNCISG
ncbi:MAG TPA: hypothetical protein VI298_10645 [Geobacteraceae bacterium]